MSTTAPGPSGVPASVGSPILVICVVLSWTTSPLFLLGLVGGLGILVLRRPASPSGT